MDMSSESSAARWYEPPVRSLEPAAAVSAAGAGVGAGGGAGSSGVVGQPGDYRGYYPHAAGPTHHPAHYAHSEYITYIYLHMSSGMLAWPREIFLSRRVH